MDAPVSRTKMGDSGLEGVGDLQASVSFGKFANDTLSWEKWSTFPANKYLDEVEKCSTAGSVAQKAAFFEAHYKNVAARKAEQEAQDKKGLAKEGDPACSDDQNCADSMCESYLVEGYLAASEPNDQNPVDEIELEGGVTDPTTELDIVDASSESKDQLPPSDDVEDKSSCQPDSPELHKSRDSVMVKDDAPIERKERSKLEKSMLSQKATNTSALRKKATNTSNLKKKPISATPSLSVASTPKFSRPLLSKSFNSESKALTKKKDDITPLNTKKPNRVESRKVAPASLSMSLNLGGANSEPAISTTMRKSLFMERMGDKDIVKRVFKAFQNNFNQLTPSDPPKPSAATEIFPGEETDIKASLTRTPQKNEGGKKLVKKSSPSSGQPGPRKTSNSTRVSNTVNADQKSSKSVPSPYGLRSQVKPANGSKVFKKLDERVNGQAAERTQLQNTDKNGAKNKMLQPGSYAKAKPIARAAVP